MAILFKTTPFGRGACRYVAALACFFLFSLSMAGHALKYPVPSYLVATTSQADYDAWLNNKSANLLRKDKRRNRPCGRGATLSMYKAKVHQAVCCGNGLDPYTGDTLRYDQIHQWNSETDKGRGGFEKQFCLLPTVDHKDPLGDFVDFEICSWLINSCKSDQTPAEFIAMCKNVAACRGRAAATPFAKAMPGGCPQLYFLPQFLAGICTEKQYIKWLEKRAWQLHSRDLRQGRPYARRGARAIYKKLIHEAVFRAGLRDPYTGETMNYGLIGTWDSTKGKDWPDGLIRNYYLMPTVDHIDPYADSLELEICSWRTNECKSGLTPREFIDVCGKVAERAQGNRLPPESGDSGSDNTGSDK